MPLLVLCLFLLGAVNISYCSASFLSDTHFCSTIVGVVDGKLRFIGTDEDPVIGGLLHVSLEFHLQSSILHTHTVTWGVLRFFEKYRVKVMK